MNILHFNQADILGGAGIAGYRLHQGLLNLGVDSRLLVGTVATKSDRVMAVPDTWRRLEHQMFRFTWIFGLNYIHKISTFDILKHKFYQNADILNFHNLHTGYFNYLAIPALTKSKPAVFTLHDMWSFTGHCAYSFECDRWKTGCGQCPDLDTYPAVGRDNTHLEWKLKNWIFSQCKLHIVTPSYWLYQQAKQSILNCFPIHHIPYGIDTEAYQPLETEQCRSLLGIPQNKKVLMFGAENLSNFRKGGDLLLKALQSLPDSLKAETILLIIGTAGETISETLKIPNINLGYITSDRLKSIVYSAADLFIFPTRADNLPLVLQESMACGTPLISFKVGGVPDIVRSGETGYLAQPEDIQDFANGIVQLLEDNEQRDRMSQNCRTMILEEYSLTLQAQRYFDLYQQILQN